MSKKSFSLPKKEQKRIWNEAITAAGPRYTANINVELPIKELFEGIGRTSNMFDEIHEFQKELTGVFKSVTSKKAKPYEERVIRDNLIRIQNEGKTFLKTVNSLGKNPLDNLDLKNTKQFEITFEWKDGRQYSALSDAVFITKE